MKRALPLLALVVLPSLAQAELSDDVRKTRNEFEFGRYERARDMALELISNNRLFSVDDRIEANRIAGLCILYTSERQEEKAKAEPYFLNVLRIDPDFQLDPFFTPPAAVAFFDRVRRDHDAELGPIRDQIKQRRLDQERREAEERARKNAPRIVKYSTRTLAVSFLPLGAGQFQNGDTTLGVVFASIQVAAAATAIGTGVAYYDLTLPGSLKVPLKDDATARALQRVQYTAIGVGLAAWIASAIQAWSSFRPEVEVGPSVSFHGDAPARLIPVVSPLAGGGLLGLQTGF